jgi:hypothetical protein
MTMSALTRSVPPPASPKPRPARSRLSVALFSGLGGGAVGGGLAYLLSGCTTCATGQNVLGVALLVGVTAMYGAWSGYSRA